MDGRVVDSLEEAILAVVSEMCGAGEARKGRELADDSFGSSSSFRRSIQSGSLLFSVFSDERQLSK